MSKPCSLFNRYRDGMLDPDRAKLFKSHLMSCPSCRNRLQLLDNLVQAVRGEDIGILGVQAGMIADRAFERGRSWDVLLLSWLRPVPVWSCLAVLALLFVLFGWTPFSRSPEPVGYDSLFATAGSQRAVEDLNDAEMEYWLETGGELQ